MKKKTLNDLSDLRMVFSTNPENQDPEDLPSDTPSSTPFAKQNLRIRVDRKHRAGKEITLLEGLDLNADELEALAKKLKSQCGIGGGVDSEIIFLQGDQRKKLPGILQKMGFGKIKVVSSQ